MNIQTYILPAYWASYLINGDDSGIESEDQYYADKFLAERNLPGPVNCGEAYFSWSHDADKTLGGGEVCEYIFLI